jgi:transcriptional regulator with XRE-family HTH domain
MTLSIGDLGRLMVEKRGAKGVRAAAAEVGISTATYSRVENGHMPDLVTFAKICKWLKRDPREFMGMTPADDSDASRAVVHFKKKKTVRQETATALGEMILAAQRALRARDELVNE